MNVITIDGSPSKRLTNQISPLINVIPVMTEMTSSDILELFLSKQMCFMMHFLNVSGAAGESVAQRRTM